MHLRFFLRPLTLTSGLFLVMALLVSLNLGERTARRQVHVIDIAMSTAEQGGFTPARLRIQAGQTVRFRFHSSDVAHAVAIGPGLGLDLGVIAPGETKEVTLSIDRPGVYTFYCNLWCSPEHWRMRGVIDVFNADGALPPANNDPVIDALTAAGIDIDSAHGAQQAAHSADHADVSITPNAAMLAALKVPDILRTPTWKRTHALVDAIAALDAANPSQTEAALAGAAAALWLEPLQDADLTDAAALYAKNCAACHGASGRGDGMAASLTPAPPAPFTATALLERRSDVLYAKIRRGGMGT
ncbi:MAG TPA: c-type cytochrome, partial [Chloroflexi bacterium]|nr:c-type cytochrome [Chloroflexota bacterium]